MILFTIVNFDINLGHFLNKTKISFEQEENLLDLIFMIIKDFEANNWQKYAVTNFQYLIKKHS
ncbi:MAG: hypothetical protein AAF770_03675 [Bacteroidota bacterium]